MTDPLIPSESDERIRNAAIEFAKRQKKSIARRLTNTDQFPREEEPVSVFMAGSPGAGKIEASRALLNSPGMRDTNILRIDPDDLRTEFEDYTGDNSWLFQAAVSILVDKIHDFALNQEQSFLLDGTLSNFEKAESNMRRSINKGRFVQVLYVYQEPLQAWEFVLAREKVEGRKIRVERFIEQYFAARDVVNRLKKRFGRQVQVDLLLKNNDGSDRFFKANVDQIDNHIPEKYTQAELEARFGVV